MKMKQFSLALMMTGLMLTGATHAEQKTVRFVTEGGFPPWNYTQADGTIAGFEIDLMKNLCERANLNCTFTAQSFDSMIPSLNAGKFDAIVDDLGITPKREKAILFSVPYASACYNFATTKNSELAKALPADNRIVSLDDSPAAEKALTQVQAALKGKRLGTMSAGTSVNFSRTYLPSTKIQQYKTADARDLDLLAGRVDAVVAGKDSLLLGSMAKDNGKAIVLAGPCFSGGIIGKGAGIGFRKEDNGLKALFDKAINEAKADGTIRRLSLPVFKMDVTPE